MKFFVSVFLFILGPFSVIKIVLGLNCYVITQKECDDDLEKAKKSDAKSSDYAFSKYFACVRQKMIQEQKDVACGKEAAGCGTLIYELKDDTQLMVKSCEKSDHSVCPNLKKFNDEEYAFKRFVKNATCHFCSSDKCNNKTPNDKSSFPAPPTTEKPAPLPTEGPLSPSLNCHTTIFDFDYLIKNCQERLFSVKHQDQIEGEKIGCMRESLSYEEDGECPAKLKATGCTTIVYELKDQTEIMLKFCDNSEHLACNTYKEKFDAWFSYLNISKSSHCEFCSSDNCNDKRPRDTPSHSDDDEPRDEPSRKEKLSASPSAVSTPLSATDAIVTVFIIHLLI